MNCLTSSIFAAGVAVSNAVTFECGRGYPASFMRYGTSAQRTLSYGVPTAAMTIDEPFLAGCAPAAGYYSTGQKIAKVNMTYAEASDLPLVVSAVSNDSDVGSVYIAYEGAKPGSALSLRPRNLTVVLSADGGDDGKNFGRFLYDSRGRLVRVNWTYTGSSAAATAPVAARRSQAARAHSPLARLHGVLPTSPVEGYEVFEYEDEANPDFVTLYSSDAFPDATFGPESVRFKWTTRDDGLVTDTSTLSWESAECKGFPCESGAKCCREIGGNKSQDGTCYNVDSCDTLGGQTRHYEYTDDGRTLSMNVSGAIQEYTYDDSNRIVEFHEGNNTYFVAQYDDHGAIHFMTYFVIYPIFPELWGFDPPAQVSPAGFVV